MKLTTTLFLVASAALTSAQATFNDDGTITCAIPDAAYCASDSLSGNIIIRCVGTVGYGANCNDNLAGQVPRGVNYAPCWETSSTSGDAACSKNCIVYEGSGSGKKNGTFTLPGCTPAVESTTTAPTSTITSVISGTNPAPTSHSTTHSGYNTTFIPSSSFITLTSTIHGSTTTVSTTATSSLSVGPIATGTGSVGTGFPGGSGNGTTLPTGGSGPGSGSGSGSGSGFGSGAASGSGVATATPKSPSSAPTIPFNGAAPANQAGLILASVGLFFAFFL